MARCFIGSLLVGLCLVLVGCSGGGTGSGGAGGGDTLLAGSLAIHTESTAGFTVLPLQSATGSAVALTCLYGAKITRLAELRAGRVACMSNRDGGAYEVYTMNADGSAQTRLTTNTAQDCHPVWSPDGQKLAFSGNADGDYEIYTMNADGSGLTQLTTDPSDDQFPAWSPDGTRLLFNSNRDGDHEIYVMNANGTGVAPLTSNGSDDVEPEWSPDGQRIVFDSNRDGDYEIYCMYANGSGQTRLTTSALRDYAPTWSPDGQKIAFASERDGSWQVYTMNPDGSGQTRITHTTAHDDQPVWTADGKKMLFQSTRYTGNPQVCSMDVDGTGVMRLSDNAGVDQYPSSSRGPSVYRTLIGSNGTDGGANPPFGSGRYLAVVGLKADEGLVSAAALSISSSYASTVAASALDYGGSSLSALKITATAISGMIEDQGRRKPYLNWSTSTLGAGAILVFFNGSTGRIQTVIGTTDTAISSAAASAPRLATTAGGKVTLRGAFTAALDARDRSRNLVAAQASQIVLDEQTGQVLSVQ